MMTKISVLTSLFFAASTSYACPALEGTYRCPPIASQDELVFSLERSEESDGRHRYTFHYDGYPDSVSYASASGVLNTEGDRQIWAYCLNDQLVYFKNNDTSGWIQQSFLSPAGDYVVNVRGQEFLRCAREAK